MTLRCLSSACPSTSRSFYLCYLLLPNTLLFPSLGLVTYPFHQVNLVMDLITIAVIFFYYFFLLLLFLLHWKLFIVLLHFPAVSQSLPCCSPVLTVMSLHGPSLHPVRDPSFQSSCWADDCLCHHPFCSVSLLYLQIPPVPSLSSLATALLLISSCSWVQPAMLHTCELWSLLPSRPIISVVSSDIQDLFNHHSILFTVFLFKPKEGEISPKFPSSAPH